VSLEFPGHAFRHAQIQICLWPREMPVQWLVSRLRGNRETLSFEADLDFPPAFSLEVHNHRWRKKTARWRKAADLESMCLVRTGPVVLTTRGDWQNDLTNMMNGLLASRDCNFESVRFQPDTPHFSATLPLDSLDLRGECAAQFFEALRELAAGASAAMF
jgi:hypothetical protein